MATRRVRASTLVWVTLLAAALGGAAVFAWRLNIIPDFQSKPAPPPPSDASPTAPAPDNTLTERTEEPHAPD